MTTIEDTTDPRVGTTFTQDGWTISVSTELDFDTARLADADCYTPAQHAAFFRGDWYFCGCIVTVSREGIELGHASLWAIESGLFTYTDEDDNVTGTGYVGPYREAVDDLIADAISDARETLARLCGSVA